MNLIWAVIPLVLIGIFGVQESNAAENVDVAVYQASSYECNYGKHCFEWWLDYTSDSFRKVSGTMQTQYLDPDLGWSSKNIKLFSGIGKVLIITDKDIMQAKLNGFVQPNAYSKYVGDGDLLTFGSSISSKSQDSPPVLTVPDKIEQNTAASKALVLFSVSAMDDEDGELVPVCTHSRGDYFSIGTTQVSCTVVDSAGNSVTKIFLIVIQDWPDPTIWHGIDPGTPSNGGVIEDIPDVDQSKSEFVFPSHQKQVFQWWADGLVSDDEMMDSITYLFETGIVQSDDLKIIDEIYSADDDFAPIQQKSNFPSHQKQVLQWWADDLVSDNEVMDSITYLFENEIIQSPKIEIAGDHKTIGTDSFNDKFEYGDGVTITLPPGTLVEILPDGSEVLTLPDGTKIEKKTEIIKLYERIGTQVVKVSHESFSTITTFPDGAVMKMGPVIDNSGWGFEYVSSYPLGAYDYPKSHDKYDGANGVLPTQERPIIDDELVDDDLPGWDDGKDDDASEGKDVEFTIDWEYNNLKFSPGQAIIISGTSLPEEKITVSIYLDNNDKGSPLKSHTIFADADGNWVDTQYIVDTEEQRYEFQVSTATDVLTHNYFSIDRHPDSPVVAKTSDGTVFTTNPIGTVIIEYADGMAVYDGADGMLTTQHPDGSITLRINGYDSTYFTDGTAVKEIYDGGVVIRNSDGTEFTINSDDTLDEIDLKFGIISEINSDVVEEPINQNTLTTPQETATASLYRLVGEYDHFYTTDENEKNNAVGYTFERVEAKIFLTQESGTVPLYRLFNGVNHFYLIDSTERNTAMAIYGYADEGIEGYVYSIQESGTIPLYRLFNGEHFYTTDLAEKNNAVANLGYADEGIECYVYPNK